MFFVSTLKVVRNILKELSNKTNIIIHPGFVSHKVTELLKIQKKKPKIVKFVVDKISWDFYTVSLFG